MESAEFLKQLQKILDTDSLTTDEEIAPVTWDSIEVLGTIALVDKAGKTVKIADILRCKTAGDLMELAGTR